MAVRITDIWIPNYGTNNVSMLDTENSYAKTDRAVGISPWGVTVDHLANIWITNNGENTVSKLDASNSYAITVYTVGTGPRGIAVDHSGNIWVANYGSDNVSKLDFANGYAKTDYPVGTSPYGIAIDQLNNVWVANYGSGNVSKLDASNSYAKTDYATGTNPICVAIDLSNNVWVTNQGNQNISKLDASNSYAKTDYALGSSVLGVVVDQSNNIWVTRNPNIISKLDASISYAITDYTVGTTPMGVAVDELDNIWTANYGSDNVSKLDASNSYTKTDYTVGDSPRSIGDMTGQIPFVLGFGGVWSNETPQSFGVDTSRLLSTAQTTGSDTSRLLSDEQTFQVDTSRTLFEPVAQTFQADTSRLLLAVQGFEADTSRVLGAVESFQADTIRIRASLPASYVSLSVNMQNGVLMDRFSIDAYEEIAIGQNMKGQIKNMLFRFAVEQTSAGSDNSVKASGVYDVDELLNKPIAYTAATTAANVVITAIALALGKTPHVLISPHTATNFTDAKPTCKEVISHYFGWTSRIPHQQVNVFIRMNDLYVIQRGMETTVRDITNIVYPVSRPTKKKLRTMQKEADTSGSDVGGQISGVETVPIYLTGTVSSGADEWTYSNGLMTKEEHTVDGVTTTKTHSYSSAMPPARHVSTTYTNAEGKVITSYEYGGEYGIEYLCRETETKFDTEDVQIGKMVKTYAPAGSGHWSYSIYEDGIYTTGGLMGGPPPSNNASPFAIGQYSMSTNAPRNDVPGRYLGNNEFPVSDSTTMTRIAAQIAWLNGKTEVRQTLDVLDETILDFDARYNYDGCEWFLESNTPELTPKSFVQKVELVRYE